MEDHVREDPAERAGEQTEKQTGKQAEEQVYPRKRHEFLWKLLRPLAAFIVWLRFGFHAVPAKVEGPFMLVCNHVTNWDPILAGCSFKEPMYFVASEHILRSGLAGKLIAWAMDPIPRQKSGSAAGTVMAMTRRLRKGYSVAVFPEGNRTWDGVTGSFLPSIGKLARTSGASLVTYKLTGGYLASPRWSGDSARRGRMEGRVVKVYSPGELKAMTPAAINEAIGRDLHEDACARARKNPIRFRGRRLAEHLETLLFLCPKCGSGALQSKDDQVRCWKCGFTFRYLPTGFLAGEDLPYDNIRDWNAWQTGEIRRMCDEAGDDPIFTDTGVRTDQVLFASDTKALGKGEMRLYRDRLELPGVTVPLAELSGMALMGPQDLYVSTKDNHYLVRSNLVRCMVKYLTACSHLRGDAELGV